MTKMASLSDGEKLLAIGLWAGIRIGIIAGAIGLAKFAWRFI